MTNTNTRMVGARRRERRYIPPFGDGSSPHALANLLSGALAECRWAPFAESNLTGDDSITLDAIRLERPMVPRFELAASRVADLRAALRCQSSNLALSVSVRSRHLRRYELLDSWGLDSLPDGVWSPPAGRLARLQSGRGMDFVVALRVVADQDGLRRRGLDPGKALARREFSAKEEADGGAFPFEWAEFGDDSQRPKELLWTIEWKGDIIEDELYSRPVSEALTVLGNNRAQAALVAMGNAPGAGDLAWKMLAAEIATHIWAEALRHCEDEPDADDTESLIGQAFARLSRVSGMGYPELQELANPERGDSLSELRGLVSKLFEVVT